jgi:putative ABC transport system permease protein
MKSAPTTPPLIELRRVTKIYGSGLAAMPALRGVDLRVQKGELVAIMGPSGSGKSTCMYILGCLDTPSAGQYLFEGVDVGGPSRRQRALLRGYYLGFVFQGFRLLHRTSALENVELPLIYRRMPRSERRAAARQALAIVGLYDREQHTPGELSGGEQQRVAIARALVTNPTVLLADEPTGNLDRARSRELMELLLTLNRNEGLTTVMVTHDAEVAGVRATHRPPGGRARGVRRHASGGRIMIGDALLLALVAIRRNALRSSLTILGIVIGVAAVIVMVTLGAGATRQVRQAIAGLGTDVLMVMPGQRMGGGQAGARPFELADAQAIAREIPSVMAVAPRASTGVIAIYANQNWSTSATGTDNQFFVVRKWPLEAGRQFTEGELRAGRAVCIVGVTVKSKLFGGGDPLGSKIRLGSLSCQVIGVLGAKGQSPIGADQDDMVVLPLRTLQRRITGNQNVNQIQALVRRGSSIEEVQREIASLMRARRHLSSGKQDDFRVTDPREIARTLTETTQTLTGLLSAVAAVILLVGGIGIMNIMLVSVTERTQEIGIRLAIGAMESDVLTQFLVEAVVLSLLGGVSGIMLALLGSVSLARLVNAPFVFNPAVVVLALVFSAAIGVLFGYFPARKAARLDPIEALRHE